jgi:hypothetical protein
MEFQKKKKEFCMVIRFVQSDPYLLALQRVYSAVT